MLLKLAYLLRNLQISHVNNSRIFRIKKSVIKRPTILRVLRVDRQILRVDRRVIRMDRRMGRRILRVDRRMGRRVLRVDRRVL